MRTFHTLALLTVLAAAPLAAASAAEMKPKPGGAMTSSGEAMKPADKTMKADDKMMTSDTKMTKPGDKTMAPGNAMRGQAGGASGPAMMKK